MPYRHSSRWYSGGRHCCTGNVRDTAMEHYKISQVITGYMGYAYYQAQKGITDLCVGRKEVSLAETLLSRQDFFLP